MKKYLALIAGYALAQYQTQKIFTRFDPPRNEKVVLDLPHVNVAFKSKLQTLHGNLFGENKKGLVVFSHGLGLNSDDYCMITKSFVEMGYQVLAFDNTGTYRSTGINTVGINQSVVDLRSALKWVMNNEELDKSNLILCGHSWGGYAVCAILTEDFPVKKVISLAGSNKATELIISRAKEMFNGLGLALSPMTMAYHLVTFKKDFFKSSVRGLNKSKIPALIVHGTQDDQIEIDETSIVSHKHKIKNKNVEYFLMEGYGHNEIFEAPHNPKEMNPILRDKIQEFLEK